jgi:hypothetical protein
MSKKITKAWKREKGQPQSVDRGDCSLKNEMGRRQPRMLETDSESYRDILGRLTKSNAAKGNRVD